MCVVFTVYLFVNMVAVVNYLIKNCVFEPSCRLIMSQQCRVSSAFDRCVIESEYMGD